MNKTKVRTRFAPSPTGYLHVGGLRTIIYAYIFAKQNKGDFLLRIEDTDRERFIPGATEKLINILPELGFKYDEGPILKNNTLISKGKFGPYIQSQRLEIYQKYAQQLLEHNQAYYCFCSSERLDAMRQEQMKNNMPPKYDGHCRNLTAAEIKAKLDAKTPYVLRMRIPENRVIKFVDLIRGEIEFNTNDIDDQVIIKSDGFPTYHLAVVVDDHLMQISHVIRGEEWVSSTPKHLLLYEYFNWQAPQFAHQSLLLNPDHTKLSKRKGDVAVEDFLQKGYLKEALINFIATIGWTEGSGNEQEIYSITDLIKKFNISRLTKAGAIFNLEKLDWINGYYIRQMKIKELNNLCLPYLKTIKPDISIKLAEKIVTISQERLKKLSDITQNIEYFWGEKLDYPKELIIWKKSNQAQTLENLIKTEDFLINLPGLCFKNLKRLEKSVINWIKKNNYGVGDILWPMRVALSGQQNSPSPFELAWVLGKKETLKRINKAQTKLKVY
ncbi:MAG: glutamate--tRNA ligase [Candidatus Parcubacteria bacterium]|nr:glutamate--tRNA ligase [Candidatus Parcubacteria bacterium]